MAGKTLRQSDWMAALHRVAACGWVRAAVLVLAVLLLLAPGVAQAQGSVIHVTPGGAGTGSGASWEHSATLQNALAAAGSGDEIWVASGVYTPGTSASATFTVTSGMQLYGGFAATETLRTQRDWTANPTILSGDIGGDDTSTNGVVITTTAIVGSNAYHVIWADGVTSNPITATTIVDGFTITAGQATGSSPNNGGGGFFCAGRGGGKECSPSLSHLTFSGNSALSGGAMLNDGGSGGSSSPSLSHLTFSGNSASSNGGAMYNSGVSGSSSPSLSNVTFSGNSASSKGGAMLNTGGSGGTSSPSLSNVTFSGNSASSNGGAMYNSGVSGTSSPSLTNVTFSGNSASSNGGAMYNYSYSGGSSSPRLTNVILWGNQAGSGNQLYNSSATAILSYTLIQSDTNDIVNSSSSVTFGPGSVTFGPGILTADPLFAAPITATAAPTTTGNYRLMFGSPAIDAGDNNAIALPTDLDGSPRVQNGTVDLGAYEAAPSPMVNLTKMASPETDVPYQGTITYTLALANGGAVTDSSVTLTDTLPAGASFADWIEQPSGANFSGDTLAWSGPVGPAEVITFTFAVTNTAAGGMTITNTAWFSGSAQSGSATSTYTTSTILTPSGSGNWSDIFPPCTGVCSYAIPNGVTITLDQNIDLTGNLTIESGGSFNANGKTVTLTGDQAQTLTGNPVTFYNLVVNKSNKTDKVTIVGKLKVSKKLTVRSGKLISASDYGDIEIDIDGELVLTNTITISGNLIVSGTLTTNDNAITFDGGVDGSETVTQTLFLSDTTWFGDINVFTNTLLVEINPNDTVFFSSGGLTNYGTIHKTQPIDSATNYPFGLASIYPGSYGMEIEVTDLTGGNPLTAIQVDRIDANHPNAPGSAATDIYWTITPSGTNYVATVVLPQNGLESPGACRYSGGVWQCDRTSFDGVTDLTVTRAGVTAFSDWAVFETAATTTTLTTSASPVDAGVLVTFTAMIDPTDAPGSVEFFADGVSLGAVAVTAGSAQTSTVGLAVGTHVVTTTLMATDLYLPTSATLSPNQEVTCLNSAIVVNTADSGAGSLRQAIGDVCAGGTVGFAPALTAGGAATITLTSGQALTLTKDVTIAGPGAELLTVSGNSATRVFAVNSGVTATIDALTIRDGKLGTGAKGAGILNSGVLTVTKSTLTGHSGPIVGYILGGAIYNDGSLSVISSTVANNTGYWGSGIYNAGALLVSDTMVDSNIGTNDGGGIYNTGTLHLLTSTVSRNSGGFGSGILNSATGTLTVTRSTVRDNFLNVVEGGPVLDGGGAFNLGRMTVQDSAFLSNTAGHGGGIYNGNGGTLMVTGATFGFNSSSDFIDMSGGGIFNAGTAVVENSTFYSNTAGSGSAIANITALTITNSSIVASVRSGVAGFGGGIYSHNTGALYLRNSLVADSIGGADCINNGTIGENTNNLVADGSCSAALSGDPLLGNFGDYGGDTQTVPLLPGSPAIDAGDAATCPVTDQRGVARPQGSVCDIGAFESRGFTLSLDSGDDQQTWVGTPFSTPLAVTVTSSFTEPVDGGRVIYTGPASGAGVAPTVYTGTIAGGTVTQIVAANLMAGGPYSVTAIATGADPAIDFRLTNTCADPATVTNSDDAGAGSLRWAIQVVCAGGTVDFDPALTAGGAATITLTSGHALTLTKNVTIAGPGAALLAVSGNSATRVFAVNSGVNATIDALTIRDGKLGTDAKGAGILNSGVLTVTKSTLTGHSGPDVGSAIYNDGSLSVISSTVANNTGYWGAGIYNAGALLVTGTMVDSNIGTDDGGGIYNTGTFHLLTSTVSRNSGNYGGGIYSAGMLTVTGSTIAQNRGESDGGGIYNDASGSITIDSSTFLDNWVGTLGAGLMNLGTGSVRNSLFQGGSTDPYGSGGGIANYATLSLAQSILISNTAYNGGGIDNNGTLTVEDTLIANNTVDGPGSGISNDRTMHILNSTIAGNSAAGDGGGIYLRNGALAITNTTIAGNAAAASGGGIYSDPGTTLDLVHVLIAGNIAGGDCRGTVNRQSHNLVEATGSDACDIANGDNGTHTGVDPLLARLAGYGGATQTYALLPGSPALDAGDPTACPPTDQRGVVRPQGSGCDIGAFESRGFGLALAGGDDQQTWVGTDFTTPLAVTVTSSFTEPVDGGVVTFTGPQSGAGASPVTSTVTITGGAGAFTPTANSTLGSYNVTAGATGATPDITYALTNTQRASATTLTSSAPSPVFGESVTFTATVSDSLGTPSGAITFTVNSTQVSAAMVDGVATYITNTFVVGSHVITATYGGDARYTGSFDAMTQVVNRAATSTALAGAPNPSVYGQSVTFTATVSVTAPGVGLPTGVVTFTDGTTELGTGTLDASGVATYTTGSLDAYDGGQSPPSPATHSITAAYGGDDSFAGSTAVAVNQVVGKATTTTTLASGINPSVYGDSVTFTATVTVRAPGAASMLGEDVTFKENTTSLGTGTLDVSGVATYSTSLLSSGVHTITAEYGGRTNITGGVSSGVVQTVNPADQSITFDTLGDKQYGADAFTVTATASSGLTVVFTSTTPSVCTVSENTVSLAENGACTIRASQAGNGNYNAASDVDRSFNLTCADSIVVNSAADSGYRTLRGAVANLCEGGVITFDAALENQNISLTTGQIEISKTLTVNGPGSDKLTVSGGGLSRIFAVGAGNAVAIDGLTLRDGWVSDANGGGAIYAAGPLTITSSSFISNTASSGGSDGQGGAISFAGGSQYTLVVSDTAILSNTAYARGGGLYVASGTLDLDNSTLTGNMASGDQELGGAIYCDNCVFTIDGTDFTENQAKHGGAFYITESSFGGQSAITSSNFQANQAAPVSNGWGGAIFVDNYRQITISDTAVLSNAAAAGGGLYIKTTDANLASRSWIAPSPATRRRAAAAASSIRAGSRSTASTSRPIVRWTVLARCRIWAGSPSWRRALSRTQRKMAARSTSSPKAPMPPSAAHCSLATRACVTAAPSTTPARCT